MHSPSHKFCFLSLFDRLITINILQSFFTLCFILNLSLSLLFISWFFYEELYNGFYLSFYLPCLLYDNKGHDDHPANAKYPIEIQLRQSPAFR